MQINVAPGTRVKPTLPTTIEGGQDARIAWTDPPKKRFFALNEVAPGTVNWRVLINEYGFMDYLDNTAPPEPAITPGEVQDWYYINLTADTHPMHTHLVSFQVVGRYKLDTVGYQNACKATPGATRTDPASGTLIYGGIDPTNYMSATPLPADPTERGFKDTVRANPGYVTVIRARFNLPAGATGAQSYVHHCHIVEHEDNDMMLPFTVGTN
jgi:FtsP/CotA-like multicopper oxidase with cupredoxin domain